MATLSLETGDFVAENGDFFAENGDKVARNGNKIACFRVYKLQSRRFRPQVWTGHYRESGAVSLECSSSTHRAFALQIGVVN